MIDGFDYDAHDRYVASGYCPKVQDKTWCNAKAGHLLSCWAERKLPNGKSEVVRLLAARPTPSQPKGPNDEG